MKDRKDMTDMKSGQHYIIYIVLVFVSLSLVVTAFIVGLLYASTQSTLESATLDIEESDFLQEELVIEDEIEIEIVDPEIVAVEGALNIDWLPIAEQAGGSLMSELDFSEITDFGTDGVSFNLGTVVGGEYDGYTLTSQTIIGHGLGTYYQTVYVLIGDNLSKPVVVDKYFSNVSSVFTRSSSQASTLAWAESTKLTSDIRIIDVLGGSVIFDTAAIIVEFEHEELIEDQQGREYRFQGVWHRLDYPNGINISDYAVMSISSEGNLRLVASEDEGSLSQFRSQFFVTREDARVVLYELDIPFWGMKTNDWNDSISEMQVPVITWNNGTKNTEEFFKGQLGGCGVSEQTNVVNISEIGALVESGTYVDGATRSVFSPVDYSTDYFSDAISTWHRWNWEDDYRLDEEMTNEEILPFFEEMVPPQFFYYQDRFGRWVEFRNSSVLPAAECGKPVIYLYPEEEMSLEVFVEPQGGFTYTEPVYNDGWRVSATPDSVIMNLDDGQVYPYLFWEGRGGLYSAPENYWVVSKNEVPRFLTKTLREIGFEGREVADFMEFWLPRMQEAEFYKIGFHGNAVMDALAPLNLSIEPDSVLRVLMDFEELDSLEESNPPQIPEFIREGFVVTEWGGVIK